MNKKLRVVGLGLCKQTTLNNGGGGGGVKGGGVGGGGGIGGRWFVDGEVGDSGDR